MEKEFKKQMESLSRKHEHSKVYVDFMDYYIYQNSNSPDKKLPSGYKDNEMKLFQDAYNLEQRITELENRINKLGG